MSMKWKTAATVFAAIASVAAWAMRRQRRTGSGLLAPRAELCSRSEQSTTDPLRRGMHLAVVRRVFGSPQVIETLPDRTQRWSYGSPSTGGVILRFDARCRLTDIERRAA